MPREPELVAHQQWLGYLQPVGLVVSPPALVQAQAFIDANVAADHQRFLEHVGEAVVPGYSSPQLIIKDFRSFAVDVLGWQDSDLIDDQDPRLTTLEVVLASYHETLRPTFAVLDDPRATPPAWLLLIQDLQTGTALDDFDPRIEHRWQASPYARFERLLRETQVPIGILFNGTHLRLVYAPRGESAGHVTFPVQAMTEVAGRPILSALLMLLGAARLFSLPDRQRLPAVLADSRKYQNTVSTELAQQVLAALFELLRGFQMADDQRKSELLRDVLAHEPDQVYAGLVTVLMRLVFLLYAEDRGLLSEEELYLRHYSVTGLFERLREDAGRYPDTMDLRYGAWGQLLALFRLVNDGGGHGRFRLPARHGYLFDPDRYPFLEGRPREHKREPRQRVTPPLVPDGVLFRVLNNLLILDGERISYRSLDVEQIGSVYEAIMGYRLEKAVGRSIALKAKKAHGAPVTINLDALLACKSADRGKWLAETADQKVEGKTLTALKEAQSVEGLVAALERKIARSLTPNIVPLDGMILQPSEERRRSGSHYTPRSLTGPIVRKALEPIIQQLGEQPTPDKILALKVCDPAMGSGAFLVEACRQLGELLITSWNTHRSMPKVPDDETPELFAQRMVAQRCLYGVDKNPMAVDLAKLSLWLVTLAKDHPFTFLDHSLKCGDSLVGLTLNQIRQFHWNPGEKEQMVTGQQELHKRIATAIHHRWNILESADYVPHKLKEEQLKLADDAVNLVRFAGNLAVAAFFAEGNEKKRTKLREDYKKALSQYLQTWDLKFKPIKEEAALREGPHPIHPFHWEIEFPEVFGRTEPGFDVIVGNPPFLGGSVLSQLLGGPKYQEWLKSQHDSAFGNADLSAYFFRRGSNLICSTGSFGMLATKTISEGDTRTTGLQTILASGQRIYHAMRSQQWPGDATVLYVVVHIVGKDNVSAGSSMLDGKIVSAINSRLHPSAEVPDPVVLESNNLKGFMGVALGSSGFLLGTEEYLQLVSDENNRACLLPYLTGDDINTSPIQRHARFAISFGSKPLEYAEQFPALLEIVRTKVQPDRARAPDHGPGKHGKKYWWQFTLRRDPLYENIEQLTRCLVTARVTACERLESWRILCTVTKENSNEHMSDPKWEGICDVTTRAVPTTATANRSAETP